jgi:hypothetical protein
MQSRGQGGRPGTPAPPPPPRETTAPRPSQGGRRPPPGLGRPVFATVGGGGGAGVPGRPPWPLDCIGFLPTSY